MVFSFRNIRSAALLACLAAPTLLVHAQVAAPGSAPMKPVATAPIEQYTGPTYDNRWELYAGLNFMNGQAGQNLPKRYNMGGGEVMGTYWLGSARVKKLGVIADYRIGAGTTPVLSTYYNRVLVRQQIFSGGVEYRGPKNRYAAVDYHALVGGTYGVFDTAVKEYPVNANSPYGSPASACQAQQNTAYQSTNLGLYCNHVAPWAAIGGSIDFNDSAKLAFRLSPDMVFEHFGTETREFFAISLGAVYRFGKTGKK